MSAPDPAAVMAELQQMHGQIIEQLEHFVTYERLEGLLGKLEKMVADHEAQIAQLLLGYSEMYVAMENIITEVMAPRSEEDKEQFRTRLASDRSEMLKMLGDSLGVERRQGDTGPPVEGLAQE